jgi:hypothetical protein
MTQVPNYWFLVSVRVCRFSNNLKEGDLHLSVARLYSIGLIVSMADTKVDALVSGGGRTHNRMKELVVAFF